MKTSIEAGERRAVSGWLIAADNPIVKGWNKFLQLLLCLNLLGITALWACSAFADSRSGSELVFRTVASETMSEQVIPSMALATKISSVVTGHIIRTTVTQEFQNPTRHWVEGVYYFPLPDDAAVDSMTLKIGERVIKSEIQEKEEARKTFAKAAASGKVAALLDQYRPNTFSTKVANVEPGGSVTVEISFQSLAKQDGPLFRYVMPQTITPRYNPGRGDDRSIPETVNGDFTPQNEFSIIVKNGAQLADLSSSSHMVIHKKMPNGDIRLFLEGGTIPTSKDFVLEWRYAEEATTKAILFKEEADGAHYLLGIIPPPSPAQDQSVKRRDITFILDVSGSMQGDGLEQGREALLQALDLLKPVDRFQIVIFNDNYQTFFQNSVPASSVNLGIARERIAGLTAERGTEMYPALQAALSQPWDRNFDRQIVFLTDGAVTNEEELFALVNEQLGDARLFTVGLGAAPNSWFMRKSAEFGRGLNVQIVDIAQAASILTDLFEDISSPSLRNIQLELGQGADSYPKISPDLYGDRPTIFLSRIPHENLKPSQKFQLLAETANKDKLSIDMNSVPLQEQAGIAKLWARYKVEGLIDAKARGMDADIVREGILDVALRHQIMSPYTSFVAVDKTPRRVQDDFLKKAGLDASAPADLVASATHVQTLATATPMKKYAVFGIIAIISAILLHIFLMKGGVRR